MVEPTGDQISPSAPVDNDVIFAGSPGKFTVVGLKSHAQICCVPSRSETNASFLPSGDQRGRSSPGPDVSCFASPPPAGITHRWGVFVFFSRFTSTALKATHFPSGETTGSFTRFRAIMSSKVKGLFTWATAKL